MKIAQVVPIWEKVPPDKYGGTQRVAYELTEGLVDKGHDVTLYATGDSKTSAKLDSIYPRALYRDEISWENHLYPILHFYEAFKSADKFDIIHCHIDRHTEYFALAMSKFIATPTVFTLHFRLPETPDRKDRRLFLEKFKDVGYISISNSQRKPIKNLNYINTVYNGIDISKIKYFEEPGDSLIWLGRFSKTKGPIEAIEVAKKAKMPLIMAGKVDKLNPADYKFYKDEVEPMIDGEQIKYIGEIDEKGKNDLFRQAYALINPIQWDEPFGLVPVEAMAAGVPPIAFNKGAMPELIIDKETGFLVEDIEQAVEMIPQVDAIDRSKCRQHVKDNFSIERMVEGYEGVYKKIVG